MRLSFQHRLILITEIVVTVAFALCVVVIYSVAKEEAIKRATMDEAQDLSRCCELLATMLRDGKDVEKVKRIATRPWSDGSGTYFVNPSVEDLAGGYKRISAVIYLPDTVPHAVPTELILSPQQILLTDTVQYADKRFVVGEIISINDMLRPTRRAVNYMVGFALFALIVLYIVLAYTIKRLSQPTVTRQNRIDSELAIARQLQREMLPPSPQRRDADPQLKIGALIEPAQEIGGDFYNHVYIADNLHFIIGDVSGKGIPASIHMAIATHLYESIASEDLAPAEIAMKLNNLLCHNNASSIFVTAIIGCVNTRSGEVILCNAGHNPPIVITPGCAARCIAVESNIPLGVLPQYQYTQSTTNLTPGAHLLAYTDGVTEAENRATAQFGLDALMSCLSGLDPLSPQEVVARIKKCVDDFTKGQKQTDDITLLDIKRPTTRSVTIRPSVDELDRLFAAASEMHLPDTTVLPMEEAVVNVINYANASAINIDLDVNPSRITITISDDGIPFDPTTQALSPTVDIAENLGGQGIRLMMSLMDTITYTRKENHNILIMTKFIDNGLQV